MADYLRRTINALSHVQTVYLGIIIIINPPSIVNQEKQRCRVFVSRRP